MDQLTTGDSSGPYPATTDALYNVMTGFGVLDYAKCNAIAAAAQKKGRLTAVQRDEKNLPGAGRPSGRSVSWSASFEKLGLKSFSFFKPLFLPGEAPPAVALRAIFFLERGAQTGVRHQASVSDSRISCFASNMSKSSHGIGQEIEEVWQQQRICHTESDKQNTSLQPKANSLMHGMPVIGEIPAVRPNSPPLKLQPVYFVPYLPPAFPMLLSFVTGNSGQVLVRS